MSQIKCMIVDDEPLAIQLLQEHMKQMPHLELVGSSQNPLEALQMIKTQEVDLLFLDIQMPLLTGIELVKTLQNPPGIIFTTAYRHFAVESYELDVIDYLMKPITFARFFKAVQKYIDIKNSNTKEPNPVNSTVDQKSSIYVNVNKKFVKIIFSEIQYVESVKDYIHIHTGIETIVTREKISDFETKIPNQFIRIHRSFIVNKNKVTAFTAQDVEIGDKEIPIGASYKEQVMAQLK